jgi:hypothetical protein
MKEKEEEEAIKMATEVVHEYTADEKRYYRLLSEKKYEPDNYNRMAETEDRGIRIGKEQGVRIGEERGMAKAEAERAAERTAAINALRAAGDARYTMVCSMVSMWVLRIGSAYLLADVFGLGVLGIWWAMLADWFGRAVAFSWRYLRGRWQQKKLLD